MSGYVALFRAVNAKVTGGLPMAILAKMCGVAGFSYGQTYSASNNVVFQSDYQEDDIRLELQRRLNEDGVQDVHVIVRNATEIIDVIARNPFPNAAGNRVVALFTDDELPAMPFAGVTGVKNEKICLGIRELFVFYPDGTANTNLVLSAERQYTARNMYTIAKLAEMANALI